MILTVCANPSVDSFWSVDHITKGATNRSKSESFFPGGKGLHVAFALKELGEDVSVSGVWGGETGKWLKDKCAERSISVFGPQVQRWSRLCITVKSASDWNETELLGSGPEVGPNEAERFMTETKNFLSNRRPKAVILSGSIPRNLENDTYSKIIANADHSGIPSFVDASGPLLQQTLQARPFAVHINQHEGKALCGSSNPAEIARWLSEYCTVAAVTAGADGLYLSVGDKFYHAYYRIDPSEIIGTTGAGDCLMAGLCAASLKNKDYARWARYAAACGSANCIHPELGMLKAKDVSAIFEKVILKEL